MFLFNVTFIFTVVDPVNMFSEEMKTNYKMNNVSFKEYPAVLGLHKFKNVKVIYSEYFLFLYENFGFEEPIKILHGVFFKHQNYLEKAITKDLKERKEIKEKLENCPNLDVKKRVLLESKANELKLKINSCYGYTLCRENSIESPYVVDMLKKDQTFKKQLQRSFKDSFITTARKFDSNHWLVSRKNINTKEFNSTPLVAIGASILGNSKIILLENVCFLLRYLDPRLAEALYFDTDSIFIGLHYSNLEDNVFQTLQKEFKEKMDHFIDSKNRLSGFLVMEKVNTKGEFYGEKMYLLTNNGKAYLSLKGIPRNVANQLVDCPKTLYQEREISAKFTSLKRKIDCPIVIQNEAKRFKKSIIPSKRVFENCHSMTYM